MGAKPTATAARPASRDGRYRVKNKVKGAQLKSLCGKGKIGTSAAKQFAEKCQKPCPQGLKPSESQALIVGAEAPTP